MHDEIGQRGGAVSFRQYMELALYHPEWGYYSSGRPRYGRSGDYLTAPTASGWYASVMARWLGDVAARTGPMTVVDVASGDGSFLKTLLASTSPDVVGRAVSVERSAALRRLQEERLECGSTAEVYSRLEEAPRPGGPAVVHMSELYDALPTHRVVRRGPKLQELWVAAAKETLRWEERPARREVAEYLTGHRVELAEGQIVEVSLEAGPMHRRLLDWVGPNAVVVVLDYGYPGARLYDPRGRMGGSLACYREHQLSRDPLEAPGKQDMTAHVNWDDLRLAADAAGWREIGLWPLAELLIRAGLAELVDERALGMERELDSAVYQERQEIKRLLDPEGMGSDLKVLVQATPGIADPVFETLASDGRTTPRKPGGIEERR